VVQVGPRTDAYQVVNAFAFEYKRATGTDLTWKDLHAANPGNVIPTCWTKKGQLIYGHMFVWVLCDPDKQGIALIAGSYLTIPMKVAENVPDRLLRLAKLDTALAVIGCTDKRIDSACLVEKTGDSNQTAPPAPASEDAQVARQKLIHDQEVKILKERLGMAVAAIVGRPTQNKWTADLIVSLFVGLMVGVLCVLTITRLRTRVPVPSVTKRKDPPLGVGVPVKIEAPAELLREISALKKEISTLKEGNAELVRKVEFEKKEREKTRLQFVKDKTDLERRLATATEMLEAVRTDSRSLVDDRLTNEHRLAEITYERDTGRIELDAMAVKHHALEMQLEAVNAECTTVRADAEKLAAALARVEEEREIIKESTRFADELVDPESKEHAIRELEEQHRKEIATRQYEGVLRFSRKLYQDMEEKTTRLNAMTDELKNLDSSPDPEAIAHHIALTGKKERLDAELQGTSSEFLDRFRKSMHVTPEDKAGLRNILNLMLAALLREEDGSPSSRPTTPSSPVLG
jgi:hypothetical protein